MALNMLAAFGSKKTKLLYINSWKNKAEIGDQCSGIAVKFKTVEIRLFTLELTEYLPGISNMTIHQI